MNNLDKQHKELIKKILEEGVKKLDRTGTGTLSIFGHQMRFKMDEGFPLLTLRKIHTRSVIHELLWFLSAYDEEYKDFGNTNIRYLLDNGVTFWTEWPHEEYLRRMQYISTKEPVLNIKEFENRIKNDDQFAKEFGSIGPGYGEQWLNSGSIEMIENIEDDVHEKDNDVIKTTKRKIIRLDGVNQIDNVIETLRKNPDSRRIIVDAWNPMRIEEMLLPACHMMFQFYSTKMKPSERRECYMKWVKENGDENIPYEDGVKIYKFPERFLSLQLYIRSQDVYLGQPFNIAEYSLLLHMISQVVNMIPNEFILTLGDAHLYSNSIDAAKTIIERDSFPLPKLIFNKNIKNIYDFRYDDIIIKDYQYHPNIKVDVAV
jgi:thymidylate synthase